MMKKICKICGNIENMLPWEDMCFSCYRKQNLISIQEQISEGNEDTDTFSSDYVICPYCGHAYETILGYGDFPEIYEEGEHEIECAECGKTFVMETMISFSWETRRTDNAKM